jgi:carbon starvation protein CstA
MLGNFHFNTETSLVLMYCVICVALLLALSLPLPFKAKQPINSLIQKTLYYLGIAALLPLWTFLNALRNLNRFSIEAKQANFSPLLADKHKGRVIKMQRNLIMGLFAVVCYVLLFRFHKVISRYDNKTNDLKNEVKAASPQSSPAATAPAAVENKKIK